MKAKVRKLFINFEKEEKWINEMAAKGMNLVDYSFGRYLFEEGTPGEYIYRIELLEQVTTHLESTTYIKFMEEMGVECVSTYGRWVTFRKKAVEGSFDLYSDYESRIKHYKRIIALISIVIFINLMGTILNLIIGITVVEDLGFHMNLWMAAISSLFAMLFVPTVISYLKKINKMKKDKQVYE